MRRLRVRAWEEGITLQLRVRKRVLSVTVNVSHGRAVSFCEKTWIIGKPHVTKRFYEWGHTDFRFSHPLTSPPRLMNAFVIKRRFCISTINISHHHEDIVSITYLRTLLRYQSLMRVIKSSSSESQDTRDDFWSDRTGPYPSLHNREEANFLSLTHFFPINGGRVS